MLNKILIYAIIMITVYFYLKLARSPLFKKELLGGNPKFIWDWGFFRSQSEFGSATHQWY